MSSRPVGGLKGFFQRTGKFFYAGGVYALDFGRTGLKVGYKYGGKFAFVVATTSLVVLMPLFFEIGREGQLLETERSQVRDLKTKGYSERQLQEMGFSELSLHSPSVASMNTK